MSNKLSQSSGWRKVRKFFNDMHLWIGLACGLIVVAVCFSGTIYVFNSELVEWANPHLYKVSYQTGDIRQRPEKAIADIEKSTGGRVVSLVIQADLGKPYQYNVKLKGDKGRSVGYLVNPYTGKILGNTKEESRMKTFMGYMFSLHRWLLLDKIEKPLIDGKSNLEVGRMINGWATILFTLGCISGLIIWIPARVKSWKQGLKIKWRAGWKRVNHDLHNSLAFYSVFFLLLMGLTGPQWSFEWYRAGMHKSLGTYKGKTKNEAVKNDPIVNSGQQFNYPILVGNYQKIADSALPYSGNLVIHLPSESESSVLINKTRAGFIAPAGVDKLMLDKATCEVKKVEIFSAKPFNERIAGSIKAIHVGSVYGTFTKWIYFVACLVATTLPVTGTIIWVNKLRKKRRKVAS